MSCDLLPEWLNLFLDDVETTLCLPILIIMVLCTVQFIINHAMDIGLTFYQNVMQKSDEDAGEAGKEKGEDLMSKIKGFTFVFFLDLKIFFFGVTLHRVLSNHAILVIS